MIIDLVKLDDFQEKVYPWSPYNLIYSDALIQRVSKNANSCIFILFSFVSSKPFIIFCS